MSLLLPSEMESEYGGTGSFTPAQVQLAIDLAEYDISESILTPLTPTTFAEEFPWPHGTGGKLMLSQRKVTSLTTVTAKHSLDADCVWTEDTECGVILDADNGIVKLVGCTLSLSDCPCDEGIIPDRAVVTYVAGFTAAETLATTSLGKALRMAIALRAQEWASALAEGAYWEGEFTVTSFSSMDYSEQRKFAEMVSPLGPGPLSMAAMRLLRHVAPFRMIMVRSASSA